MSLNSLGRLAAFLLLPTAVLSCSTGTDERPIEIRFDTAGTAVLRSLQFYLYDIELVDEKGAAHPLKLAGPVVLVDLTAPASAPGARSVRGTIGSGAGASLFRAIRFTVGVPFELNHANPLMASPPLDRGDLFWTWQSGYKFLRADFMVGGLESSFHLGSTGCSSASALRPPAQPCAQPNRMRVELAGDPLKAVVRFQTAALGAAVCTGSYAHDPACASGYASTALQAASGTCVDEYCSAQKLWTLD
jgi:uncharacterized repeat protein (TIGR04052 family)